MNQSTQFCSESTPNFVALDCRTVKGQVVEAAAVRFVSGRPVDSFEAVVRPTDKLEDEWLIAHDLGFEAFEEAPSLDDIADDLREFVGKDPIVAHDARLFGTLLPMLAWSRWIDSNRVARQLWPDAPGYDLATLLVWAGIRDSFPGDPRSAFAKAWLTGLLFACEWDVFDLDTLECASVEDLVELSESPINVTRMHYGKAHVGERIGGLDDLYLNAVLSDALRPKEHRDIDADHDTVAAVVTELATRLTRVPLSKRCANSVVCCA